MIGVVVGLSVWAVVWWIGCWWWLRPAAEDRISDRWLDERTRNRR